MKFFLLACLFMLSPYLFAQKLHHGFLYQGEDVLIAGKTFATYEGMIDVPEDYGSPASRRLQLPVFMVKSSGPHPGEPVFWLDGGPGASNIMSRKKISVTSAAHVLKNHDFICVGYRGVDGSTVLASKKVSRAFKGLRHQLLSPKSVQNLQKKIKNYRKELEDKGIDISQYNIMNVIEDLETVRKKLGYTRINLFSLSYGTRVALLYSYKYPEVIQKTLMAGACPPGYFLARPEHTEMVLDRYDALFKARHDSLGISSMRSLMEKAFEQLPKRWSLFKLDADKIKSGTFNALYSVSFAVSALDAYKKAALNKDYSGLFMLQKLSDISTPETIGDIYAKTVSADWQDQFNYGQPDTLTLLGSNVSYLYGASAGSWNIRLIPESYRKCSHSSTETLIISSDLDHRTPPSVVDEVLMPYLSNSRHWILDNSSHADILMHIMKNPVFLGDFFDGLPSDKQAINPTLKTNLNPSVKLSKGMIFLMGVFK